MRVAKKAWADPPLEADAQGRTGLEPTLPEEKPPPPESTTEGDSADDFRARFSARLALLWCAN